MIAYTATGQRTGLSTPRRHRGRRVRGEGPEVNFGKIQARGQFLRGWGTGEAALVLHARPAGAVLDGPLMKGREGYTATLLSSTAGDPNFARGRAPIRPLVTPSPSSRPRTRNATLRPMTAPHTGTSPLVSVDPATGDAVGSLPTTSIDAIPRLVFQAREAQRGWGALTHAQRAEVLRPAAARLKSEAKRLGELASREMGKPVAEAIGEANYCADSCSGELDEIVAALADVVREDKNASSILRHAPLGVCAAITPWNFPILMPHQSVLPALVAGNSVLLKPSEETTLVACEYAKILNEFLPTGVLTPVFGDGAQGRALVLADVNLIVFTGSRETGKRILADAGPGLKRVILELGGKDPLVVLDDADLELAAAFAVRNSFRNAGQVCVSTERIYVDAQIREEFLRKMVARTNALKQGDPREPGVNVGPMVNARQKAKVVAQIDAAVAAGATLVVGGEPRDGNFVAPTILADVDHSMEVMREETFGPVACVQAFTTVDEAVRLANDTPFGLGAAVFGRDVARASDVAARIEAGMVGINQGCGGADGCPWVGAKESGYGFHSGPEGHRQFAQVRVITAAKRGA
jgi:acyl-CoA reductase-like NAD-dependent aldehyde dehydrogenase